MGITPDTLKRLDDGGFLSFEEGLALLRNASTAELTEAADALKRRIHGNKVSYVHNVNQTLTNICFHECCFCRFQTPLTGQGAFVADIPEVLSNLARFPGVTELFLQGGVYPKLRYGFYKDLVREVKSAFPRIHLRAFSPTEIMYLSEDSGHSTREVLQELQALGLDSMPGTAAEVLVDEVRELICAVKINTQTWVRIIREAHQLDLLTSATLLYGHLEKQDHVVRHLDLLRTLQAETGGFTEFSPVLFQPEGTQLGSKIPPRTAEERLDWAKRVTAISRLFLGRSIPHLQSYWPSLGWESGLQALGWGCDDFAGTECETPREDVIEPLQATPGKITADLRERGLEPWERDTLYHPVLAGAVAA